LEKKLGRHRKAMWEEKRKMIPGNDGASPCTILISKGRAPGQGSDGERFGIGGDKKFGKETYRMELLPSKLSKEKKNGGNY